MSESGSPILQETIRLDVEVPQQVKGLSELLSQLEQVKKAALAADAALDKAMGANRHTLAELKATIRELQKGGSGPALSLTVPDLSKAFNLRGFKTYVAQHREELKREFTSAP